jgi:hypothetical protein
MGGRRPAGIPDHAMRRDMGIVVARLSQRSNQVAGAGA